MANSSCFINSLLYTIRRFSMIEKGDRVLVAVSGGPDSVALLHALWSLRDDLDIDLHVAHLNHSFRGEESDSDAKYVADLSGNLGLPFTVEKIDIPHIQKALRLSAEEAARLVRHDFLDRTADQVGATKIALGHTADDQVETVLLNLLRGTGIDGLSGMPPVRDRLIRPLISVKRSQVEEYVAQNDLHPRTDITNLQPEYTRNKVRLELLPLLRQEFNTDIDAGILRLSELARDDSTYLNMEAANVLSRITIEKDEKLAVDVEGFSALPAALQRRVIREAIRGVRSEITDIGFVHIESIIKLLDAGSDFDYDLPKGMFVRRKVKKLAFLTKRLYAEPVIYCYELAVPGKTAIPEIDAAVIIESMAKLVDPVRPPGSMEIVLDQKCLVGKLRVRSWKPGDRIQPFGMTGSKKIQDIFVDAKVPRESRDRVPIMEDGQKIIWVAGFALSDLVKVTESTGDFIVMRVTSY